MTGAAGAAVSRVHENEVSLDSRSVFGFTCFSEYTRVASVAAATTSENVPPAEQVLYTEGTQQLFPGRRAIVYHTEATDPPYGRYSATHYKLDVYNRWGQLIRVMEDSIDLCSGFPPETIGWDGKVDGQYVQEGVYNMRLYLKNCRYQDWVPMKVTWCSRLETICLDSECLLSLIRFNPCGFLKDLACYEVGQRCLGTSSDFIFKTTFTP